MQLKLLQLDIDLKLFLWGLVPDDFIRGFHRTLPFVVFFAQAPGNGSPEDDWSVTAKQMLLGFAEQIVLPNSPLDELIDRLGGAGAVAEMTGRKGRIVRRDSSDKPQYESRGSEASKEMESLNVREVRIRLWF